MLRAAGLSESATDYALASRAKSTGKRASGRGKSAIVTHSFDLHRKQTEALPWPVHEPHARNPRAA